MKSNDYQIKQLQNAINILRDTCDRAEHELRQDRPVLNAIAAVNHAFMWGIANASMGIETALSSYSRESEKGLV